MDPYQFAYRENRSTDDAIAITLHRVLSHLEPAAKLDPNAYCGILFVDYSSVFNTIVPEKLYSKLTNLKVIPEPICRWILDFLLNREQFVKISGPNGLHQMSDPIVLNTGAPQGCCLFPMLYSIFTQDCETADRSASLITQKFRD
jgi:hypothetical protein